ncbi:hypothetical protein TD95_004575, partial [Thielaviopsis punctulata]
MKLFAALSMVALVAATPSLDQKLIIKGAPLEALDAVSEYFNLLAHKVHTYKSLDSAPACDPSSAILPSSNLPALSPKLSLLHIAVGRGTQNYTCADATASTVPKAAGATAALFNSTCPSALYPALDIVIPKLSVHFPMTNWTALDTHHLGPTGLAASGIHYFQPFDHNSTTPFFNLDHIALGNAQVSLNASDPAPKDAPTGQKGEKAVAWLQLIKRDGFDGKFEQVYRVNTVGGSPPATCSGMPKTFTVEYSA